MQLPPSFDPRLTRGVVLLAFLAVGALLYFAQDVFIPVAMGLFLALLLTPAVDRLQSWHVPRGLAVAIVFLVVFAGAAVALNSIWTPASDWLQRAPQTLRRLDPTLKPVRAALAQLDAVAARAGQLAQSEAQRQNQPLIATTAEKLSALTVTKSLFEWLMVVPLTLFFLLGGPPLLARLGATLTGNEASYRTLRLTETIRREIGRYFGTVALINVGLGVCTSTAFFALGMPNPILWGTVAAVLNFVPYLGPIIATLIFASAAIVSFDSLGRALAVPGVFVALHLIEGQLVQPLTVGRRLEVNALVLLLGVWFGFAFWGIPGVLLATPALVALKVAAEHEPAWPLVRNFLSPNSYWNPKSMKRVVNTNAEAGLQKIEKARDLAA
jgi:predicted PurR-regulated permease PerM